MNPSLLIRLMACLGLVRAEAGPEGSNYQLLNLIDQANPQGPHFRPLNGLASLKPTAKSFQVQWRPSFYSGISTFQDSQAQTPDNLLQYQIQINNGQHQQQPQLFPQQPQQFSQQPKIAPIQQQPLTLQPLHQAEQLTAPAPVVKPQQIIRKKPSMSSSRANQIIRPGSLFGKLRKQGDGFDDAGTFFKYDFHPEEKLAMVASLDY